jgi:acyl transferase domain-containing protein/acyl carrier protein
LRQGTRADRDDIAIIGMACRFPRSSDYWNYWQLLAQGEHAIREIPPSRWDPQLYYSPDFNEPDKSISKWCGLVDEIASFDHRFFNISEREAKSMDPQQRLLLEETWHCIEDAGVPLKQLRAETTSVYVGFMASDYHQVSAALDRPIDSYAALGSYSSILANRISHTFGLHGMSVAVDAACASSLVVLHEARCSLQRGETDFAIAAGVSLNFHPWKYISFSKSRMLSPDGRCKTFDKDANGYVPGDGVGVLLLRPLARALEAGNHIYGILSGTAVNHTGASRSITAPRVVSQRDVILDAYQDAGWNPETVTYVEAHGTGTSLGDPIEVEALTQAFRRYTSKRQYCAIGSVKSNIGHLEAAAGVAGVIKVLMMMEHRVIPQTLHVQTANPLIHFEETPFVLATRASEWRPAGDLPLRAGVSSFGFGGVNAHVLLSAHVSAHEHDRARRSARPRAGLGDPHEPLSRETSPVAHMPLARPQGQDEMTAAEEREGTIFIVSAQSASSLTKTMQRWESFADEHLVKKSWPTSLGDLCATMATGRESFAYRHGFYVDDEQEFQRLIKQPPSSIAKTSSPRWMMRSGALPLGQGKPVSSLMGARHLLKRHLDQLQSCLQQLDIDLPPLEAYRSGSEPGHDQPLVAFLFAHAYISALADLNFRPYAITGEGHGIWLALAQSGILPPSEIVAVLGARKEWRELSPHRPTLPFFDPLRSTYLMPYLLDVEYLRSLMEALPVPAAELREMLARARLLLRTQFTFKKFLAEWSAALQSLDTTPERLLEEDLPASEARASLAAIVAQSAMRKLNRRWQLTERLSSDDPRFDELVDLVVDGLMSREALVQLVLDPRPDLHGIAEVVHRRQDLLDVSQPYRVLRRRSEHLEEKEVGHFPAWIRRLIDLETAGLPSELPEENVAFLDFGTLASASHPQRVSEPRLTVPALDQPVQLTALRLWLEGSDLRWNGLFPETHFAKIPLPGYVFEKKQFWLSAGRGVAPLTRVSGHPDGAPEEAVASGVGSGRPSPPPVTRLQRAVTPVDRLIADHVISDRAIVPGALMVEMALEASQRVHTHPTTVLKDILFQRPVPVDSPIDLMIEIEPEHRRFSGRVGSHGVCRGAYGHEPPNPLEPLEPAVRECGRRQDGAGLYSDLARVGYRYGDSLQVITATGRVGSCHVFDLRPRATGAALLTDVDPALLDGLLQAVLVVGQRLGLFREGDAIYVPQAIARIEQLAPLTSVCLICVDEHELSIKDYGLLADLRAYDPLGVGLLRAEGIFFRKVSPGFIDSPPERVAEGAPAAPPSSGEVAPSMPAPACYQPVWERQAPVGHGEAAPRRHAHAVAILRPEAESAGWLEPLRARYSQLTVALLDSSSAQTADGRFTLRDDQEEDFSTLLRRVERGAPGEAVDVYFLGALTPEVRLPSSSPTSNDPALGPEEEAAARGLFLLAKAIVKSAMPCHLVIGTRRCQALLREDRGEGFRHGALSGIARTLAQENPRVHVHLVDFDAADPRACAGHLIDECSVLDPVDDVAYRDGVRYIRGFAPLEEPGVESAPPSFQDGRVYLLIGGAGGIGLHLAEYITSQVQAHLVLVGRSQLGPEAKLRLAAMNSHGSEVLHRVADVSDPHQCQELIETTRQRFGAIHGVLQLAGVVEDRLIAGKSWDSVRREMAPKAQGTWLLHRLTQGEPLEFFVTFSSVVSLLGNRGQVGYAAANGFLDSFIHYRARTDAPGKSFGVNWTLWEDGGMGGNPGVTLQFSARGLPPVRERAAFQALDRLMSHCGSPQAIVLAQAAEHLFAKPSTQPALHAVAPGQEHRGGDQDQDTEQERGSGNMANVSKSSNSHNKGPAAAGADRPRIARIEEDLRRFISSKIQAASHEIDVDESFFALGVDSVVLQEITEKLEHAHGSLPPTLLFENPNIRQLALYLAGRAPLQPAAPPEAVAAPAEPPPGERTPAPDAPSAPAAPRSRRPDASAIAIVGMSARFPKSPDVDAFWQNLLAGRDCIDEIPADRWDHRHFFEATPQPDKTYGKWGGFIEDMACFDTMFFNISPREAEQMDPQQRLFLECSWATMEHAGYGDPRSYKDRAVGLFVGVMWNEYSHIGSQLTLQTSRYAGPGSLYWAIANRVSYWMNFKGPSLAIDTACSSSLIAVHLACMSIQNGECDMAVAGGVNLSIHPDKYLYLAQSKFLSADGRCRSFGEGGTGYVPSEGVGAVLLKPLDHALRDGDHVYGILRGSATNHGGRATGFTVPDPEAQASLVFDALQRARVSPDQLGYIECHGTGTSLGDPIEILGLSKAFLKAGATRRSFPIGSVKSNLGHLEAAAGIAALIKVLLCMQHQAIPRSLHSQVKNPNINFEDVPFEVVHETRPWQGDGRTSRFAGISSFGAGGSNAHVIVESYEPHVRGAAGEDAAGEEALILLSARSRERLDAMMARLRDYLRVQTDGSPSLGDMAYTLQVGRLPMDQRVAIIAASREELLARLDAVLAGRGEVPGVFQGQVHGQKTASFSMDGDEDDREYLERLVRNRKLPKLASLWLQGHSFHWPLLHQGRSRKRIALPTYPFARERYWLPDVESAPAPALAQAPALGNASVPRAVAGDLEDFFFHPEWSLAPLDPAIAAGGAAVQTALLIYTPEGKLLADALAAKHPGARTARILLGARRGPELHDLSQEIQADDPAALERALRGLAAAGLARLDAVYFLGGLSAQAPAAGDLDALESSQQRGLLSLFRLVKALHTLGLASSSCHLKIITNNVCAVRAGDPERPFAAAIYGLARSITKEYPHFKVSCIDIPTQGLSRPDQGALAGAVIAEPGHLRGKEIALRDGKRFQCTMAAMALPPQAAEPYRQGGVYLILGGAGGLGYLFSQHLAETHNARLVWVGRRPLSADIQANIAGIEARGGKVLYLQADAGDPAALRAAFARARAHFGAIHGVVHSAVVLGNHPLATTEEATFSAGVRAKIIGSLALHQAAAGEPLDFLLYFGSIASFLNNGGASPYAAGCTFQDRYATFQRSRVPYPVRLINWGPWGKVGAVADTAEIQEQQFRAIGVGAIAPADGMEAVRRVLAQRVPQVVVTQLIAGQPADLFGYELGHELSVHPERFEPLLDRSLARIQPDLNAVRGLLQYQSSFDKLERFSEDLLLCTFQSMGAFSQAGIRESAAALRDRLGIARRYGRLCDSLLAILEGAGYLRIEGDGLFTTDRVTLKTHEIQPQMQQLAVLPEIEPYVRLLWACYQRYPELLRDQVPATDVLFPQGSMDLMGRLYKGNATADHFNELVIKSLRAVVEARIAQLRQGEKIAILEVGAGTGGTSASVLKALDPYAPHLEYFYTDISRAFTQYGKRQYGPHHNFITFQPLNLEEDVAAQGYSVGHFDVVLGANVVHATKDLRSTLQNIKSLLKANGWLILNEMTQVVHFLTISAGLLDGWWLFQDEAERMKWSPLLSSSMWKGLLEEEGFTRVAPLNHSDGTSSWTIQNVILAESNGVSKRRQTRQLAAQPAPSATDAAVTETPRAVAPAPSLPAAQPAAAPRPLSLQAIEGKIINSLARTLQIVEPSIDPEVPFTTFGVDSIFAVEVADVISRELGISLRSTALFNYPTTRTLAEHIVTTFAPTGTAAAPADAPPQALQAQLPPTRPLAPIQAPAPERPLAPPQALARERIRQITVDALAEVLAIDAGEFEISAIPAEYGIDAEQAVAVSCRINQLLGTSVTAMDLLRSETIADFVDHLLASVPAPRSETEARAPIAAAPLTPTPPPAVASMSPRSMNIAVVGMSGRLPDAETVADYWRNLCDGHDAVREIPPDRWPLDGFYDPDPNAAARSYSKWGGFLSNIGDFDPLFFGISPLEAEATDPQQRLFLQEAWKALEDAGYSAGSLSGQRCCVFVGCKDGDYVYKLGASADASYRLIGNTLSILSARISYFLNLKGLSVPIDTACSSSLVAIHLACQSLICGSSDIAVAGGVALMTTPISHVMLSKTGMLSPTGSCRTFDDSADGLVPGEAVAAVILKPLDAALRDRNHIYGVIRGSEANQDGKSNGITAPNTPSQTALEVEVYRKFDVHPETIGYIETHGTGTKLGDPIEIHALTDAFATFTDKKRFCPIGSVKTNIGHTLAASGVSSLIKVLCCLQHRTLVPSLHFDRPSKHIDFDNSPFYVNTTRKDWVPVGDFPRRAAISAFGMSGTNVHLIVEEAPAEAQDTAPTVAPYTLIPLSAKAPGPLHRKVVELAAWLDAGGSDRELGDIGYTLGFGRTHFALRLAFVARDTRDLHRQLAAWLAHHPAAADVPAPAGQPESAFEQLALYVMKELREAPPVQAEAYREKLQALANAYVTKHDPDWAALYSGQARCLVSLPTYPFNNRRFWIDEQPRYGVEHGASPAVGPSAAPRPEPALLARPPSEARPSGRADQQAAPVLYFRPVWEPAALESTANQLRGPVLLFDADDAVRASLLDRCGPVLLVKPGADFRELGGGRYELNPDDDAGYQRLAATLGQQSMLPRHVLYLWPLTQAHARNSPTGPFFHAASLCRAFADPLPTRGESIGVLYVYRRHGDRLDSSHAAMSGLARSLQLDVPHLHLKTLGLDAQPANGTLSDLLLAEMTAPYQGAVRYQQQQRQVQRPQPWRPDGETSSPFRSRGVYLITGGAGGLGRAFAEHLARRYQARLALCGRFPLSPAGDDLLRRLTQLGAEAAYIRADIADREDVFALLGRVEARFGALHGVLHSAGVTADANLRNKTREQMAAVLAPKVLGTLHLDDATRHRELDFFALFSSMTAVLGNMGQTDYGYANSFMDHFAAWREAERQGGRRTGRTVSINWPLWRDGGMRVSQEVQTLLASTFGMTALSSETGIEACERAMASAAHQVLVLAGDEARVHRMLGFPATSPAGALSPTTPQRSAPGRARVGASSSSATAVSSALAEGVKALLLRAVSTVLKVTPEELNYQAPLREYGLESINVIVLANHLNQKYELGITPVRFFEHETMAALGSWLCEEYEDHLARRLGLAPALPVELPVTEKAHEPGRRAPAPMGQDNQAAQRLDPAMPSLGAEPIAASLEPIAIIGISGALPRSSDLNAFWEHLESGRSLISELPEGRWDWRSYDNGDSNRKGLRWGGFYEDMDKFDPMFFGLSAREAELMDPQQRVFLQTVWKAIEDAGYNPSALAQSNTGVFVGASTADYLDLLVGHRTEAYALTGTTHSILANRVSFLLNLHGPSEPINTACSSALIAIHRAAEAIRAGACDMAIAGGVNAILGPTTALAIAKAGMLSPDGKCKTFDQSADGYVRAEGAGALLLKPLRRALADGDHVYAVIKGSAENHGGRANSLTAPSPRAQADLIVTAFRRAGVDPATVGYIETHGTGTALGDPIEINGLKMAFEQLYQDYERPAPALPHCALGSVKTNVGHMEAAAGIPSVFKVLLAMKRRKLPKNLHLHNLNPYIQLEGSPFRILTETEDWKPARDDQGRPLPLRAGISSFGFGGSNAHLVLEGFDQDRPGESPMVEGRPGSYLIVLSGKDEERLNDTIDSWIAFLRDTASGARPALEHISYTLLTGREIMDTRFACIANDLDDLAAKLSRYRAGETAVDGVFTGRDKERLGLASQLIEGEEGRQFLRVLLHNRNWTQLARLWVAGLADLDWSSLFQGTRTRRVSLPTYPFARERYWVPLGGDKERASTSVNGVHPPASAAGAPHPMIDANVSSLDGLVFQKSLDAQAFYLKDHIVAGNMILPGVGHLELARAAGELAGRRPVRVIRDIMWLKPILLDGPHHEVRVVVAPGKQGVEYQIRHESEGHSVLYSQGKLAYETQSNGHSGPDHYDLDAIRSRCRYRQDHEAFYRQYKDAGFHYGPSFRVNQEVHGNERESLGALVLPEHLRQEFSRFGLHPSLLDASLQAITGIRVTSGDGAPSLSIPFSLDRLEIFGPLPPVCHAYATLAARRGEGTREILKFNVAVLDEAGRVLVRITDFSARAFKQAQERAPAAQERAPAAQAAQAAQPVNYYYSTWTRKAL